MSTSSRATKITNAPLQPPVPGHHPSQTRHFHQSDDLLRHRQEAMLKISNVSNSINSICEKLFDLLKMKLGKDSTPNTISMEKDIQMEKEFGKSLESFETE